MTYGPCPASFVLKRCIELREEIAEDKDWSKRPEKSARFGRLGMLEDLARHVAEHQEWADENVPRYLQLSLEDFVLIAEPKHH